MAAGVEALPVVGEQGAADLHHDAAHAARSPGRRSSHANDLCAQLPASVAGEGLHRKHGSSELGGERFPERRVLRSRHQVHLVEHDPPLARRQLGAVAAQLAYEDLRAPAKAARGPTPASTM